jgi:hypothetical protein
MSTMAVKQVSQKVVVPMINDAHRRGAMKFSVKMVFMMFAVGLLAAGVVGANATETVNYDTAWTFVYDGGTYKDGSVTMDKFKDVKSLPDGSVVCAGVSGDTSSNSDQIFIMKLSNSGKMQWKRLFKRSKSYTYANALSIAKNGDLIIGGGYMSSPVIMRADSNCNIQWTIWYYDSLNNKRLLSKSAMVNSLLETSDGRIVCAAGDEFPSNGGYALNNYFAYLDIEPNGQVNKVGQWYGTGYDIGGFCVEIDDQSNYIIAGNQAVFSLDTAGTIIWKKKYTFFLPGVGTEINNVTRCRKLRDGTLMVIGQAYEGNCWTDYTKLYYDAWWSTLSAGGSNNDWDTAGVQGANDKIYDVTQLLNGNLVFIGTKGTASDSGLWAFVTDSIGKTILWERQYDLPGKDSTGGRFKNVLPFSVCAAPDSGFTVVGYVNTPGNNYNACAFHFVPKPPVGVRNLREPLCATRVMQVQKRGPIVQFEAAEGRTEQLAIEIFSVNGRCIAKLQSLDGEVAEWNTRGMSKGVYFYRVRVGRVVTSGKIGL